MSSYHRIDSVYSERQDSMKIVKVLSVAAVVFLLTLLISMFVVPPGSVGIVVTFGSVQSYPSGLHFRKPFVSTLEMLSLKTQLIEEKSHTPTKEGLSVELDTAILFHFNEEKVGDLYKKVGVNYIKNLIEPEAASAIRGLTSESEAKDLYTSARNKIQKDIKEELSEKLSVRGINITDVLLKGVTLPKEVTKAIEMKVKAEQEAARMEFVLQKEKKEAERKSIEAKGIAEFQRIVTEGISPELLKWKGIEATERFASAPNTKIVIMGNDGNGLPVLLSADEKVQ